jgi:hypothetical protein
MAFGFGGLLGGGAVPDVQMPDGLPVSGGQGSPLVDAFLALQAQRIKDAVTAPQRSWSGELPIWDPATGHTTEEAQNAASGMAGLAMTGSMPFKAPAGAIRSFGGAAAHDDPLAALSAAMDHGIASAETVARPISRVDPAAPSWDLYHGTSAPTDFARFETNLPQAQRPHTPGSETGGVFLSPAPAEAAHYAGDIVGKDTIPGAGPRVIRTTVDPGKTDVFDLPHLLENDPAFVARARQAVIDENGGRETAGRQFDERHARMLDEFRSARDLNAQLAEAGYPATEVPQVQWGYGAAGAAMQMARERGLDTAVLRGLSESNGGDQVVALTPGRVRSFYDPSQILYSGGPGAAAGLPALASSSDPKGPPSERRHPLRRYCADVPRRHGPGPARRGAARDPARPGRPGSGRAPAGRLADGPRSLGCAVDDRRSDARAADAGASTGRAGAVDGRRTAARDAACGRPADHQRPAEPARARASGRG